MYLLLIAFIAHAFAYEDIHQAPKSFTVKNKQAVFVDFTQAQYDITYNLKTQKAEVVSKITFYQNQKGHPLFDLKESPTSLLINGLNSTQELISTPQNETKLRLLSVELEEGLHQLTVSAPLTQLVQFEKNGVKSAFWATDLEDRGYLERYMVANYEFDRVPMKMSVKFVGENLNQKIYTNGELTQISSSEYSIDYPDFYTSSSVYFHTVPEGSMKEVNFYYRSIDGRDLPVTIYVGSNPTWWTAQEILDRFKVATIKIMDELEADYGPFLHSKIIIYNAGLGGMEYCGATMTEFRALGHELHHSYFARGLMPVNGNAGWIDEAIASWRDDGYKRIANLSGSSRMASRPYYTRTTDTDAYSFGARFMGYLDNQLADSGGLKPFLRSLVQTQVFTPFSTEEFIGFLTNFSNARSWSGEFQRYVYGTRSFSESGGMLKKKSISHPYHQKMTIEQLQNFL